jgi:hypothetical protein
VAWSASGTTSCNLFLQEHSRQIRRFQWLTKNQDEPPWLWFTKRRIATRISSGALGGDAASSLTCGYMAGAVLVGVLLNALFHWWWAEDVAALVFLFFLIAETREALEEARGEGGDDDD